MRKWLGLCCLTAAILVSVTGCAQVASILPFGGEDAEPAETAQLDDGDGGHITVGAPEEDLTFQLSQPEDPEFEDTPMTTEGVEPTPGPEVEDDGLYIERDGYAYRLDPATLDVIDVPLDPDTKEPIMASDDANDVMSGSVVEQEPVVSPAPTPTAVPAPTMDGSVSTETEEPGDDSESATRVEPTEDNRYPNTGIFLEDD